MEGPGPGRAQLPATVHILDLALQLVPGDTSQADRIEHTLFPSLLTGFKT